MSDQVIELLRTLRPADAGRSDELLSQQRRDALLASIVSVERPGSRQRPRRRAGALGARRRPLLLSTLGAAGAIALVVVLLSTGSAVRPPEAAAITFHTVASGNIVATVTDPFAAEAQLNAAFAAQGLSITMNLIPTSPSLVGTVVYSSGEGITPLQGGHCVTGGGACAIGVEVSRDFTGQGYITLGRPARPGEAYESTTSAFAPGEQLHCSGLLGAQVSSALPVLASDNVTVLRWREVTDGQVSHSFDDATAPLQNYIWDADPVAPGQVDIWTKPQPWPGDVRHGSLFNTGCPAAGG